MLSSGGCEVVGNRLGSVTANVGLKIGPELDGSGSETVRKVASEQVNALHIERDNFRGEPNGTLAFRRTILLPRAPSSRMAVM